MQGTFTCVVCQVTMCDPIWQVMLHSSEMGSHTQLHTHFYISVFVTPFLEYSRLGEVPKGNWKVSLRTVCSSWCQTNTVNHQWKYVYILRYYAMKSCNIFQLIYATDDASWGVLQVVMNLLQKHDTCPNRRRRETYQWLGQWSVAARRTFHQ